jgi:hypothetical protein
MSAEGNVMRSKRIHSINESIPISITFGKSIVTKELQNANDCTPIVTADGIITVWSNSHESNASSPIINILASLALTISSATAALNVACPIILTPDCMYISTMTDLHDVDIEFASSVTVPDITNNPPLFVISVGVVKQSLSQQTSVPATVGIAAANSHKINNDILQTVYNYV